MPSSRSHAAKSGWSDGPWPQIPMYLPSCVACGDGARDQCLDGRIALVEQVGDEARVAVERQRELGEVVGADREAVEVSQELLGQDGVGRASRTS